MFDILSYLNSSLLQFNSQLPTTKPGPTIPTTPIPSKQPTGFPTKFPTKQPTGQPSKVSTLSML